MRTSTNCKQNSRSVTEHQGKNAQQMDLSKLEVDDFHSPVVEGYLRVTIDCSFEVFVTKSHVTSFPGVQHVLHLFRPHLE